MSHLNRINIFILSAIFTAALLVATDAECNKAKQKYNVVDKIAAVVNDDIITQSEVDETVSQNKKVTQREALEKLIDEKLLKQAVEKSDVAVKDDELQNTIANIMRRQGISFEQMKEELRQKGLSYEEYKDQIREEIKSVKFVQERISPLVSITERDLQDFYNQHPERFQKSYKAHIARILFTIPKNLTQEGMDIIVSTAEDVSRMAKKGDSFASLAKKYSKGAEAAKGGDMGMIEVKDLPPPLPDAIPQLSPGDVSQPIYTQEGIFIIKLISFGKMTSDAFEKIREKIYEQLFDQRVSEEITNFVQKEKKKSYIEIR
ncbi:MAG: peptidylprolyl isomerase [Pseudomonadota bacterium]